VSDIVGVPALELSPFKLALNCVGVVPVFELGAAGRGLFQVLCFCDNVFEAVTGVPHGLVGVCLVVFVVEDFVEFVVDVAADAVCLAYGSDLGIQVVFCQAVTRVAGVFVFE